MNFWAQLVSATISVFMAPFGDNSTMAPIAESIRKSPSMCETALFTFGENELKLSLAPRGLCPNCCPVDFDADVQFVVYTKANPSRGALLHKITAGAARKAGVDPAAPTQIFIHGFTEPSPGHSGRAIVDAYLSRPENYNVILVDWSKLCPFPWYPNAVKNVKIVAETLTKLLVTFNDSGEIPIEKVHVIGFSLGSHIAAFTGKKLRARRSMRIPRITALDPALPEYSLRDPSGRLNSTDADYVDVIHTDAGVLGLPISVGHADFYPNGGRALQPGCQPSYLVQIRLIDQIFACSHVRSWRLFAESVKNQDAFPATKCKLWRGPNKECNFTMDATMGHFSANTTRGQFFLITDFKEPYMKTALQQQRMK